MIPSLFNEPILGMEAPTTKLRLTGLGEDDIMKGGSDIESIIRQLASYLKIQDGRIERLERRVESIPEKKTPEVARELDQHEDEDAAQIQRKITKFRKNAMAKFKATCVPAFNGSNYRDWKKFILEDADSIQARDLLEEEQMEPPTTIGALGQGIWKEKNRLLHLRICRTLSTEVYDSFEIDETDHVAADLWKTLRYTYGTSQLEKRLEVTKQLRDLRVQDGNILRYIVGFFSLRLALYNCGADWTPSTYHDLFILGLEGWKDEFMQMAPVEVLHTLQAPVEDSDMTGVVYPFLLRATLAKEEAKAAEQINRAEQSPSRPTRDPQIDPVHRKPKRQSCQYCGLFFHQEKACWFKHPHLATAGWRAKNKARIEELNKDKAEDNTPDCLSPFMLRQIAEILDLRPAYMDD